MIFEAEQRAELLRDLRREQIPERPPPPYSRVLATEQERRRLALERDVVIYDWEHRSNCQTDPQH